jgi:ribonuclease HII
MIGEDDVREWLEGNSVIGVDEAGRGPLAGSMFIGVVAFPPEQAQAIHEIGLRDSKKIAEKKRFTIEKSILKLGQCAVGAVRAEEINSGINLNDLWSRCAASMIARFLEDYKDPVVFVDGSIKIKGIDPDIQVTKPKFDSLSWAVAAASIIAKNAQVRAMLALDSKYPQYNFSRHKGYATAIHRAAIRKHGVTAEHRQGWVK